MYFETDAKRETAVWDHFETSFRFSFFNKKTVWMNFKTTALFQFQPAFLMAAKQEATVWDHPSLSNLLNETRYFYIWLPRKKPLF